MLNMRIRTVAVLVVLALIGAFLAVNWAAITATAKFRLLVTTIEAPVGLVMLAIVALIVATFIAYLVVWQGAALADARRHGKELQAQKALADQAEASRFVELRELVRDEFRRLDEQIARQAEGLRAEIRDNANSIAATIGELDDRMHKPRGGDSS
ncbi:MAG TPA: hypothetical protein VMV25_12495 [Steroidobacteraceae bacterium]|nr:hypothetical protein [Steroidobacteraceae bacterium]